MVKTKVHTQASCKKVLAVGTLQLSITMQKAWAIFGCVSRYNEHDELNNTDPSATFVCYL